ncbi:C39 family peptidase, partial [Myxococcota bacterium]|nr:C39 family peptidase [Myxococcota bacterium]
MLDPGATEDAQRSRAQPSRAVAALAPIRALYEAHRFIDAFDATRTLWARRELPDGLGAEQLIFVGRLAGRLGSDGLRAALFRRAARVAPADPYVRYYVGFRFGERRGLFDQLAELDRDPELATDDPDLRASWHAQHAMALAVVRDFDGAHRAFARADQCGQDRAWVDTCRASVLLAEDRFEEAFAMAERAWERSPGRPNAAIMLVLTASPLGRREETAARLLAFSRARPQSWELLLTALRAALAAAERETHDGRRRRAIELLAEAEPLSALAPLAGRGTRRQIDHVRLKLAELVGDRAAVRALAERVGGPFYRRAVKNLDASPAGARFLVHHRFNRQRHNTCLPASLASCLGAFGIDVDQDELARRLTFEGTAWWRAVEWAKGAGLVARSFIATPDTSAKLLEAGVPFVVGHQYLNGAHACTAVGLDQGKGTLLYHDPSSDSLGEVLIDGLGQLEAPLGPRALVVVPPSIAPRLDGLTLAHEDEETARVELERRLELGAGADEIAAIVDGVVARGRTGPVVDHLVAIAASIANDRTRAHAIHRALYEAHPTSLLLQRTLVESVASLGNAAELRELLRSIVERTPLPGFSQKGDWIHPDPFLVARYADALVHSAPHRTEARRVIARALAADPRAGSAYHTLGQLLWSSGDRERAALAYRFASTLDYGSEPLAAAYAQALRLLGRLGEALTWLERRVAHYTGDVGAEGPWISLIELEE